MNEERGYKELFAQFVEVVNRNAARLTEIYENPRDIEMVCKNAELMYVDNLATDDLMQGIWGGFLKLLSQRDEAVGAAFNQLIRNIEYYLDLDNDEDHGKGQIILDLITGKLDDPVWEDYRNQALHFLLAAADDVMQRREEAQGQDEYAEVG